MLKYPLYFAILILVLVFVGAASFAGGMVIGVDAVATGNYGQYITIAIVVAIVAAAAAIPLSLFLVRRRGRGGRFL
ncbi:MAG: hypothetical protein M3315_11310 [Actinomycetota bacterium]|jgi:magnesium-transporting ATPase (P-type)|nr:hypothetical protein [Actinomycetota bacterium]